MAASAATPPPEVVAYEKAHFNDTLAPGIYAGAVICLVVTLGSTALRLVARRQRKAPLKSDDWLMVVAALFTVPLAFLRIYSAADGTNGRHIWAVDPTKFTSFVKEVIAFSFLYCLEVGIIRASILMLYLRLFPVARFKTQVWIVQVIQLAFVGAVGLSFLLQCIPLAKAWNPKLPGHCVNTTALVIGSASINIFVDLAVFLLPVPVLMGLQIPTSRKLALCAVFAMGSGVCFVSVYRAIRSRDFQSPDFTWNTVILGHLNLIESMGGIFCGNATVIYPLFARPVARWTSSLSSFVKPSRSKVDSNKSATSGKMSWPSKKAPRSGSSEIALSELEHSVSAKVRSNTREEDLEALSFPPKHGITVEKDIGWTSTPKRPIT